MPPRHCSIIAKQIAQALDQQQNQAPDYQPSQRYGRAGADGGQYRSKITGFDETRIGSEFPALAKKEWLSGIGYLNNSGPSGAIAATLFDRHVNLVDIRKGLEYTQYFKNAVRGLSEDEWKNVHSRIEERLIVPDANGFNTYAIGTHKNIKPISPKADAAYNAFKQYMSVAEPRAAREIRGYKPVTNRLMEMYDTSRLSNPEFHQQSIDGLAIKEAKRNGRTIPNAQDMQTGQQLYQNYTHNQYAHVGSNIRDQLYLDRVDGRIYNLENIADFYVGQHQRMLVEKELFGMREDIHKPPALVGELLKQVKAENIGKQFVPVVAEAMSNDTFGIHPHDPTMHGAVVRSLMNLQTFKLTFSTLKHGSRAFNAWMKTDLPTVASAMNALVSNSQELFGMPAREFAGSFASVGRNAVYESTLFQPEGLIGRIGETILKYNGFTPVDRAARKLTGTAGAMYAQKQALNFAESGGKKAARLLEEFGIVPEVARREIQQNGKLSLENLMIAGQKLINASDGRGRTMDLPFFTANNDHFWRAILTFRTFPLNQVRLVWDMVYQNPARLGIFALGIMPAMGTMLRGFEDFMTHDVAGVPLPAYRQHEDGIQSYLGAMTMGTSMGYISEMADMVYMAGGKPLPTLRFFEPPVMSTLDEMMTMAGHVVRGDTKHLAWDMQRQFGGLGSAWLRASR